MVGPVVLPPMHSDTTYLDDADPARAAAAIRFPAVRSILWDSEVMCKSASISI